MPGPDEKVVARSTTVSAGGPALNAAVTAALLRMPARLVTAVGSSPLATVVRADVAGQGVELVDLAAPGFEVPLSTVLLTEATGERAVVSRNASGPSAAVRVPDGSTLGPLLEDVAAVLVDGHHLAAAVALAAAARERGIPVLLDAGSWKPGLDALVAHVDVLVASADFRSPAGDSLSALLALGPSWVARSAGAGPVAWRSADGTEGAVEVPRVEVVDTLGAGDVLHGALLAGMARRGTTALPAVLAEAVDVAARSVAAPGARGWARPAP